MKKTFKALFATLLALTILVGGIVSTQAISFAVDPYLTATGMLEPVNPDATQEARNLLAYLSSLTQTNQFVVGQFDISTDEQVLKLLEKQYGTAAMPALYSCRYILNEDLTIANMDEANDLLEKHYNAGDILLVHIDGIIGLNSFKAHGVKNRIVDCDITNPDRDMAVYEMWDTYFNNFFEALADLEKRGVKAYMVRDFVEFNHGSSPDHTFYGTDQEGYDAFTRVYQQTVQRYLDSDLNGWLQTYSPISFGDTYDRYPGNEYLDVLGITLYTDYDNSRFMEESFGSYDWMVATGKPVGLAEVSVRHGETGSAMKRNTWYIGLQDMMAKWPRISWVNVWGNGSYSLNDVGPDGNPLTGLDDGKAFLHSPFSITTANMADYRSGVWQNPGVAQLYTAANWEGAYIGLEQRVYTAAELKKMGITEKTLKSFKLNDGYGLYLYDGDNATGDYWGFPDSVRNVAGVMGDAKLKSLAIIRQSNIALNQNEIYASHNDDQAWMANDGAMSCWTGEDEEGWLHIYFMNPVTINRYAVQNASAAGQTPLYNTAGWKLQYTLDGENWITVDEVTGNTAGTYTKSVAPFTASEVRLWITQPNSAVGLEALKMAIAEFELYGMDLGKTQVVAPAPGGDSGEDDTDPGADGETEEDTDGYTDGETEEDTDVNINTDADTDTEDVTTDDEDADYTEEDNDSVEEEETSDPEDTSNLEDTDDDDSTGGKKKPVQIVTTETYFPWWAWLLIGLGVLAAAAVVVVIILVRKKKKQAIEATA